MRVEKGIKSSGSTFTSFGTAPDLTATREWQALMAPRSTVTERMDDKWLPAVRVAPLRTKIAMLAVIIFQLAMTAAIILLTHWY